MNWKIIEEKINETIPKCIKKVLDICGYDTIIAEIKNDSIANIEKTINDQFASTVQTFDCCYSDYYKSQQQFKFLPGHADLLRGISKVNFTAQNSDFSPTLQSTVNDFHREKGNHRAKYSDFNRYFATYIFLKAGRSCYEFLCNNLPLPSVKTVCE